MSLATRSAAIGVRATAASVNTAFGLVMRIVNACDTDEAYMRLDNFVRRAEKSTEKCEAAFAAVQAARDLGAIDDAEAAWLFREVALVAVRPLEWEDSEIANLTNAYRELLRQAPRDERGIPVPPEDELEEIERGRDRCRAPFMAAYHRERGESALATLIVESLDEYGEQCESGESSLMLYQLELPPWLLSSPDPERVAYFEGRIARFAKAKNKRECDAAMDMLRRGIERPDIVSAVTAVQRARDSGTIPKELAVVLMEAFLHAAVWDALECDRPYVQLQRSLRAVNDVAECIHDTKKWRAIASERQRAITARVTTRFYGATERVSRLRACWLRRFGEHELANTLLDLSGGDDSLMKRFWMDVRRGLDSG